MEQEYVFSQLDSKQRHAVPLATSCMTAYMPSARHVSSEAQVWCMPSIWEEIFEN